MKFYITRHGQPDITEDTQYPPGDPPLSELGRKQARCLGERLENMGFSGKVLSSPYDRTAETADVICSVLRTSFYPEPIIREYTNPAHMKNLTGLTLAQLSERFRNLANDSTLEYPWWTTDASQSETSDQVTARVKPLTDKLSKGNDDVLLVGHGASTVACARALLKISLEESKVSEVSYPNWNCNLTIIEAKRNSAELDLMRSVAHLAPDLITSNKLTLEVYEQQLAANEK